VLNGELPSVWSNEMETFWDVVLLYCICPE